MQTLAPAEKPVKRSLLSAVATGAFGASIVRVFFETDPQGERVFAFFLAALLVAIQGARLEIEMRAAK